MLAATRRAIASIPSCTSKASYATVSAAQNGVKVASIEESGPTASLAVVVKGGSRLETAQNIGAAHFLKNYGFKNNANRTAFRITREAELAGGVLSSNVTHETIVYAAEFLTEDAEHFAENLGDVVTKQKFGEHEFVDVAHQTALETANALATPEIVALEAAHQTAFRSGLGNSIFARSTSSVNNAAVKAFASQLFTQGNIALVGTGLSHETVQRLAETYLNLPAGEVTLEASKYYGGESRIELGSKNGHYVIAFEGAALDSSEFAAAQVLRFALGGDKTVKHTTGSGILAQTAAKFGTEAELKAFNFGYSDAGLFGVYVSAPSASASSAVAAAAEQLRAVTKGVSGEDLQRAIAQAKFAVAAGNTATRLDQLETLGTQALFHGKHTASLESVAAFDKISSSEVAKVAEKILKSKATTVAIGDVHNLPYADSVSL